MLMTEIFVLLVLNDLQSECTKEMKRCYELLNLTSRSFAAVIQALDPELRPSICIFYLVLRGLDTVEDDMSIKNRYVQTAFHDVFGISLVWKCLHPVACIATGQFD